CGACSWQAGESTLPRQWDCPKDPSNGRDPRPIKGLGPRDDTNEVRRMGRQIWRNAPFSLGVAGFIVLTLQTELGLGGAWLAHFDNDYVYDGILVLAALNCFLCVRGRPDRTAWIWIGIAILAWAAGDIYYTWF